MIGEIDVRKSVARRQYTGRLELTFEADKSLLDLPYAQFSSPVGADLSYEIFEDDSLEVKGKLSYRLKGLCSRCLKETERVVETDVDLLFVPDPKEDDGEAYGYFGGIVRLDQALSEAVLFSLPGRLECETACNLPEWDAE